MGTSLKIDVAIIIKSRPNLAKVKVDVDLLKSLPKNIFVGQEGHRVGIKGHEQKLEYQGVPAFYKTYKLKGHDHINCKV